MDDRTFDHLAKALSASPSRRGLLAGLLAPLALSATEAGARGKGKPKGKRKGKGKGKGCKTASRDRLCAGQCGPITNRCGKWVECEPCAACAADGRSDGTACTPSGGGTGICTGDSCVSCGQPGESCCAGATPCANFGCCDPATGRCVAGGGVAGRDFAPKCEGETMVCDCGQRLQVRNEGHTYTCTRPGVCRPNHAPQAFDISIRNPWRSPCVPITFWFLDADFDEARFFRVVELPQSGYLTQFPGRQLPTSEATGVDARLASVEASTSPALYPVLNFNSIDNEPGWATALPAPPLPDDVSFNCYPRCRTGLGTCRNSEWCPDCQNNEYRLICPEAEYQALAACWIPFQETFTGLDSFKWAVIDQHGAQSEPATVNIEIFECGVPCI